MGNVNYRYKYPAPIFGGAALPTRRRWLVARNGMDASTLLVEIGAQTGRPIFNEDLPAVRAPSM
jgi:hypothetical protein